MRRYRLLAAALLLAGCSDSGPLLDAPRAPAAPTATLFCHYGVSESIYTNVPPPSTTIDATGEVGTHFIPQVDGKVLALKFYKATGETGTHTARLWTGSGTLLASATFGTETSSGWQTVTILGGNVSANGSYVVSVNNNTRHAKTFGVFTAGSIYSSPNGNLEADYSLWDPTLGAIPTTGSSSGFYVDVVFRPRICEETP
jgi:hypothetical protein